MDDFGAGISEHRRLKGEQLAPSSSAHRELSRTRWCTGSQCRSETQREATHLISDRSLLGKEKDGRTSLLGRRSNCSLEALLQCPFLASSV